MKKAIELRYHLAYVISLIAIISASFGRGLYLLLFLFPLFMSYLFRIKGRVVLHGREGNIIAGLMTLGFIPLFFLQDVFVMALYYLLGLMLVKLFVSSSDRDYDHVALLGFLSFSMSTIFLYSVWYVVLYVLFILLLSFYLFVRIIPGEQVLDKKMMRYVLFVFPLIILFAVLLFFLLPRNPFMLFGMNTVAQGSDFENLEVGMFEKESLSQRVLFRVKPLSTSCSHLYIRLRVFTSFNGREWNATEKWSRSENGRVEISRNPGYISGNYRIYLATRFSYVPLVDYPLLLLWEGGRFAFFPDLMEVKIRKLPKKSTYTVYSLSRPPLPLLYGNNGYLQIPDSLKKYLIGTLNKIDFSGDTLYSIIEFLRKNHKYGRFIPTIDTLLPISEFLLYNRSGECTEFATAFVLLARMAGYRTRMVAGFLTKEFNPLGKYFIVREKYAHAWAEVLKDGRWIRYDPTPPSGGQGGIVVRLREYYDFIQYIWFTRVVEYSYQDQMKIALKIMPYYWKLRMSSAKRFVKYALIGFLIVIFTGYLVFAFLLVPFERRAVLKFIRYMEKKGYHRKRGETIMELAKRSKDKRAIDFATEYYRVRYGGHSREVLKRILKSL